MSLSRFCFCWEALLKSLSSAHWKQQDKSTAPATKEAGPRLWRRLSHLSYSLSIRMDGVFWLQCQKSHLDKNNLQDVSLHQLLGVTWCSLEFYLYINDPMKLRDFCSWDDSDNYYWKKNETPRPLWRSTCFQQWELQDQEARTTDWSAFCTLLSSTQFTPRVAGRWCVQCAEKQLGPGHKPCWSATAWTTVRQGWAGATRSFHAWL